MAQYIEKDALLAELERLRMQDGNPYYPSETADKYYARGVHFTCDGLFNFLDTLEVKEVDLEDAKKEELAQKYVDYIVKRHNIDANSIEGKLIYYAYMHGMNQCLNQLKVSKGE